MSEILREWLLKFGVTLSSEVSLFEKQISDGVIIATILHRFAIINTQQLSKVLPSSKEETVKNNFKYISNWLKSVNLEAKGDKIIASVKNETDIALNILFQLYIKLVDKCLYNLADSIVAEQRIFENQTRFDVKAVLQENGDGKKNTDVDFTKYIENNEHLLNWHILQKAQLVQYCKEKRKLYESHFQTENKDLINISDKHSRVDLADDIYLLPKDTYESNYDVLLSDSKRIQETQIPIPVKSEGNKFLKNLSHKYKFIEDEESFKANIYEILLLKILKKNIKDNYGEYEEHVLRKLIKLSYYEKQLITKLLAVQEQKNIVMDNGKKLDSHLMDTQEYICEYSDFLRREKLWDRFLMSSTEENRYDELEQRLFQEKERLKIERIANFCRRCAEKIVSVSLSIAQYKEGHGEEPSWKLVHDWVGLFIKDKKIFPILEHIEDLVLYDGNSSVDDAFCMELKRQDTVENRGVIEYIRREAPFTIETFPELKACFNNTKLGDSIMSKVLYKMLLVKYPKPKSLSVENIPKYEIAASVVNLTNTPCISFLKKLLSGKGIVVIEMCDAINYCLNCYKEQADEEYRVESINNVTTSTLQFLKDKREGNFKFEKPKPKGTKSGGRRNQSLTSATDKPFEDEGNQTPNKFPCEKFILSDSAHLGKLSFEILSLGGAIDSRMLIDMFVEYLKSKTNINGWVLVNFPQTLRDAIILEKTLTGKFPFVPEDLEELSTIEDICSLELRNLNILPEFDSNAKFRKAVFIDITEENEPLSATQSFLNQFILLKEQKTPNEGNYAEKEKISKQNSVKEFYSERCSTYTLHYQKMNYHAVKQLAKFLAGDTSLHPKSSLELFGDTIKYLENNVCSNSKSGIHEIEEKLKLSENESTLIENNYSVPPENAPAKGKKGKKNKNTLILIKEDKSTQIPKSESASISKLQTGITDWQYMFSEIPTEIATILTTMWETAEEIYLNDGKQWNYGHRVNINLHLPYVTFFNTYIKSFMCHPDRKQEILHDFQVSFNSIEDYLREDEEMKAELHYRIITLREDLCKVPAEKFQEATESRLAIISDNWVAKMVVQCMSLYVLGLIYLVEHMVEKLQIVIDYYTTAATKIPSKEILPIENVFSTKCDFVLDEELNQIIEYVTTLLNLKEVNYNPIDNFVNKHHDDYFSILNKYKENFYKLFSLKKKKNSKKDNKGTDCSNELKRLYEECKIISEGEYARGFTELYLLKFYCALSWNSIIEYHKYRLSLNAETVENIYNKEIENIDKICEVFRWAVESETRVQPRLVLDQATIYVQPDIIFYEDPLAESESPKIEKFDDYIFTIDQLNKLTDLFETISPNGYIPEPYFLQLFQDIIIQDAEEGLAKMVPRYWCQLSTSDMARISTKFFGNIAYIPWRDFIIYNMYVPFPSEKQLLAIKKQFEKHDPDLTQNVQRYQYNTVKFWFEHKISEAPEKLRFREMKQLLARLFSVTNETINYINLLISFCKDEEIVKGVAKALTVITGKYVCWNYAEGNDFVDQLMKETEPELNDIPDSYTHSPSFYAEEKSDKNYYFLEGYEERSQFDDYLFLFPKDYFTRMPPLEECSSEETYSSSEPDIFEEKLYFLSKRILILVFGAIFPHIFNVEGTQVHYFKFKLNNIYESCRRNDFDNRVLAHEFLNNYYFLELFKKNHKFLDINPKNVINYLLSNNDAVKI